MAGPAALPSKEAHPLRVAQDCRPAVGLEKRVIGSDVPRRLGRCLLGSPRLRMLSQGRASTATPICAAQAILMCKEQDLFFADETYLLAAVVGGSALFRRRALSARVPVRRRRLRPLRLALLLLLRNAQLTRCLPCQRRITMRGVSKTSNSSICSIKTALWPSVRPAHLAKQRALTCEQSTDQTELLPCDTAAMSALMDGVGFNDGH